MSVRRRERGEEKESRLGGPGWGTEIKENVGRKETPCV